MSSNSHAERVRREKPEQETDLWFRYRQIGIKAVAAAARDEAKEADASGDPELKSGAKEKPMDDSTKTARRNFDQATAAGENAVRDAQAGYVAAMENASDLNGKLVGMVQANAEAALEASSEMARAKNPADLAQAWSTHATKQFAMLTDQARELTEAWQKFFIPPR